MLHSTKPSKHQKHLSNLGMLGLSASDIVFLESPTAYRETLLTLIKQAKQRIYLVALYLENDEAGQEVLEAVYQAKLTTPSLDINIFVDWHRAQRGRIGEENTLTNADWYYQMTQKYPQVTIPVYGVPVNTRELLGVLHLKGSVIDDAVLYTGASINNVYLHKKDKYRLDRYQQITQKQLADSFVSYINEAFLNQISVPKLNIEQRIKTADFKNDIKTFRTELKTRKYHFSADNVSKEEIGIRPIVGLGKGNRLNRTINHLINSTEHKVTICTPYFNLPPVLSKSIQRLLKHGKMVEIIVGDKTANDFYIPESEPFKLIGALPYLYEINLRNFVRKLQRFIDNNQLTIRLWKDDDNTYHAKGVWIDDNWILLTGNNLNPRAWRLDLENALLIHDPCYSLLSQKSAELDSIRKNTKQIDHFEQLQATHFYPPKVRKLFNRLRPIRLDRLISRIL